MKSQETSVFEGFTDRETFTSIPNTFFQRLLEEIDDLEELKVTLHALWRIGNMEGPVRMLRTRDFATLVPDPGRVLEKAVSRGSLLVVERGKEAYYFLNSPRGRLAVEAFREGKLDPETLGISSSPVARPNLYKLYEENIGPLTPLIADALRDAEATYDPAWVTEALEIAVKNNKRNWKYVEAILHRWKEDGHAKKQAGRNTQEDGRRYTKGEYAEFVEH